MKIARAVLLMIVGGAATLSAQTRVAYDARVYAGYFGQNTHAGERGPTATTWLMAHPQFSRFGFDVMLSADPLLNGECGQPRLLPDSFYCGDAESLSHPLLMNLGASAAFAAFELTASLVGEPAYGPHPHFMRASAQHDPGEPLTHHFFNPAHSAHGVVTAGVRQRGFGVEASAFNGRQVTGRYRVDVAPFDAGAVRLSWTPSDRLHVQVSAAYFPAYESGEHAHGGVMRAYSVTATGWWRHVDYTIGCAAHHTMQFTPRACLAEGTLTAGAHNFFARVEAVDRLEQTAVAIIAPDGSHQHITESNMLQTGEVAAGYGTRLPSRFGWQPSFGVRASVTAIPSYFELRYRERQAFAFTVFTSLRPAQTTTHAH